MATEPTTDSNVDYLFDGDDDFPVQDNQELSCATHEDVILAAPPVGIECSEQPRPMTCEGTSHSLTTYKPTLVAAPLSTPVFYQSTSPGGSGLTLPQISQLSSCQKTVSLLAGGNTTSGSTPSCLPTPETTSSPASQTGGRKRSAWVSEELSSNKRRKSSSVGNALGHNRQISPCSQG
jgi:hypothetical protein